jgi:enoyl-[acyl-carrier protein] reductase I
MLAGKFGAVFGFASHRALAWSVARSWQRAGCRVAFALQSERFRPALDKLTAEWPEKPHVVYCDVKSDPQIKDACAQIAEHSGGRVDAVLHAMAYASQAAMRGRISECSREDFQLANDISVYSLIAITRELGPVLYRGYETWPPSEPELSLVRSPGAAHEAETSSVITLSYVGAERVVPGYKVMGIAKAALEQTVRYLAADLGPRAVRVNAISAGPVDTLAARGIPGFVDMKRQGIAKSPLGREVEPMDVGGCAAFLASDLSNGITGQVLHVDNGLSIMAP